MHGSRAERTFRSALIALIGVLFMSVGAASAFAGGSDHGNGLGQQKWTSDKGQQSDGQWDSKSSEDESWSDDSESSDDNGKDCKKEESSTGEQSGEQTSTPPTGQTGGEQQGGEQGENGEHGKKEEEEQGKKEEEHKGGEKSQGGSTPTQPQQTTPAVVTTPTTPTTPAPVQAQQAPASGEVQGVAEESPEETGKGGSSPNRGGNVLAENTATTPTASESGLASTGFDAWQLALLGAVCIAGSALLLRRTRRS